MSPICGRLARVCSTGVPWGPRQCPSAIRSWDEFAALSDPAPMISQISDSRARAGRFRGRVARGPFSPWPVWAPGRKPATSQTAAGVVLAPIGPDPCFAHLRVVAQVPKWAVTTLAAGQSPASSRRRASPPRRRACVRDQS
jgi:hypothetical protein